jgi:mono/diheme cytochrome c family protein
MRVCSSVLSPARCAWWLLLFVFSCSTAAAVFAQTGSSMKPATGKPVDGQRLFMRMACYYCHGTEGQGSIGGVGPRIALVPRSYESFARYVRRPTGRMTAYSETILSEAELTDIYAFLRSLPPARPVSEIPLLEQLRKR